MKEKKIILDIRNLTIAFDNNGLRKTILKNANAHICENEVVVFVGDSGSGKSTLAHSIMGFNYLDYSILEGEIVYDNQNILNLKSNREFRGKHVSYIGQDPNSALNPMYSIEYQMAEFLKKTGWKKSHYRKRIIEFLNHLEFDNPDEILKSYPHQLSEGMKQRVLIAMALLQSPKILIADEPTSNLDVITKAEIINFILELKTKKIINSLVFITHDFKVASAISDRIYLMENLQCKEFTANHRKEYSIDYKYNRIKQSNLKLQPILELKKVHVSFKEDRIFKGKFTKEILKNISLKIISGSHLGIIGPSGAGKTTISRLLVNVLKEVSPNYILEGHVIYRNNSTMVDFLKLKDKEMRSIRKAIHLIFQNPKLSFNPKFSVLTSLNKVYRNFYPDASKEEFLQRIEMLLDLTKLNKNLLDRFPYEMSGGEAQIIAIIRALIHNPEILIFDESFSMLDFKLKDRLFKLLMEIENTFKTTYIFVTHDISSVIDFIDELVVIDNGEIVESGKRDKVLSNPQETITKQIVSSSNLSQYKP